VTVVTALSRRTGRAMTCEERLRAAVMLRNFMMQYKVLGR
jgi:hypothetical protein